MRARTGVLFVATFACVVVCWLASAHVHSIASGTALANSLAALTTFAGGSRRQRRAPSRPSNKAGARVCGLNAAREQNTTRVPRLPTPTSDRFAAVRKVMAWVSQFDLDRNALLCSHEVNQMPRDVRIFIPRFDRLVKDLLSFPDGGRLCLRFHMIERALFQLPGHTLDAVALNFSHPNLAMQTDSGCAYAFEGIPDFRRHSQWPYVSAEALESAATFAYHGKDAVVSSVWRPEDVQTGDIVSVRGVGVSQQFWDTVHPRINATYIVLVLTEGEDVLPGRFKSRLGDETVGKFYVANPDQPNAGTNPKLKPLPLGLVWRTDGRQLLEMGRTAPPILDASRKVDVLIMYSTTSSERQKAREALRISLHGSNLLHELDAVNGTEATLAIYRGTKFVVSPSGAGPDCHRNYEAMAMGAVPIVLRHAGLDQLFKDEAVLIVDTWSDVTAELIKQWRPAAAHNQSRIIWQDVWHRAFEKDVAEIMGTTD